MRIFMIGCGAVAQCTLPILIKELNIDPSTITVMDFVDNRHRIDKTMLNAITYKQFKITRDNYANVLAEHLKEGDICIDLGWDIDTITLVRWCHEHGVRYINSSIELWQPYENVRSKDPRDLTLYARHMALQKEIAKWQNKKGATAILDHGANPGLVSHFTKEALIDISHAIIKQKPQDSRITALQEALSRNDFPQLAYLSGLKTIQIAERDSQITNVPKKMNEFVNTWSIAGLYEEGVAPAELGWGTHEKDLPSTILFHNEGPKNQICLASRGFDTLARSWVPSGDIIGMVIRHGEAFGLSDRLTIRHDNKALYRPTVYYTYCVSDATLASIYELRMRQLELQPSLRILNDDIIDGKDELGCFLTGHDFKGWWTGSVLDIHTARKLVPHQNATTVQVAVAVVAGVNYLMKYPQEGVCLPDDLDHRHIMSFAKKYLGDFISQPVDWSPLTRKEGYFDYLGKPCAPSDEWQCVNYLITECTRI